MASVLQYATAPRMDDLNRFLNFWRDHQSVKDFNLVDRAGTGVVFNVNLKSKIGWVTNAILENNAQYSTSVLVAKGIERWHVFLDEGNKSSLFSRLDGLGVVRIDSARSFEFGRDGSLPGLGFPSTLSPKQLWVLRAAVEEGYFELPRRVESRELAARLGIAQSTFLEHLRKGQRKLLLEALGGSSQYKLAK